ncbi:MAG: pirin family protein [Ottowia sp.]|nr:pirin family protein [Ottowia sp.]
MSETLTLNTTRKTVLSTRPAPDHHWVGNGFRVHGMFGYSGDGVAERSPFLLLDYAAPVAFAPTRYRRGVGSHPHRGFETVTIVYDGEVEHRDSTGAGSVVRAGDVQWMTAGAGIVHREFHTPEYAARGGPFEMVQLWVNLPARDKGVPAHYQGLTAAQIPSVTLPADVGRVRVIAGRFGGVSGPARTHSPMNVLDVRLTRDAQVELPQPQGWNTLLMVLSGTVQVNGQTILRGPHLATLSSAGEGLTVEANNDVKLLLLSGKPLDEPVVGYGPFVMNSEAEIRQAIADFESG